MDIEPEELLERLTSGNVYREDQAENAAVNFFNVENLTALREIALRRCADRVNLPDGKCPDSKPQLLSYRRAYSRMSFFITL